MKKLVLSCILTVGFGIYGFSTNKVEIQTQNSEKEVKENPKKKAERYDFSLFRFAKSYTRQPEEKDSTKIIEQSTPLLKSKDETTYHYVRPLDFFKFS